MHMPTSSHWLWHPAWMPSLTNSCFNPLSCFALLYRSPPHLTWALKLTLGRFPTPCRSPLHLIWALILLHLGPLPPIPNKCRPPNGSSTQLSWEGKDKRRGGSERASARRNRCGICSVQNDYAWNHSFLIAFSHISTSIWSLAPWSLLCGACNWLETSMNLQSLGSSFISLFFLIPRDFLGFHFELYYALKISGLWLCVQSTYEFVMRKILFLSV